MNTICKLCKQPKPLLNSHIIPELCFKSLYDDKHRAEVIKSDSLQKGLIQKGMREKLLCECCEAKLSIYEKYFNDFWFQNSALPSKINEEMVFVDSIDYEKFKLFHLSILWRASVARKRPFTAVKLGPYEEKLRKMIFSGSPG